MFICFPKQSYRKEYSCPIEPPTHLVTPYLHTTSSDHSLAFDFFSLFLPFVQQTATSHSALHQNAHLIIYLTEQPIYPLLIAATP